ncbi:MAG: recombination protein RecR [Deltaproteobacteria bacterium]|nr:recombination protein RecR [Deltaproteobacteria bacterium]
MADPILELTALLARLPGVGERTATRLAYHILENPRDYAEALGTALCEIHKRVQRCESCGNYAEGPICAICSDPTRESNRICVVARPTDVNAIERGRIYRGRYYVLHALLSPLDGMGPEKLSLQPLVERVEKRDVKEVILATPLSVDGEATALFIARRLQELEVKCSRIASGLPHGGELEYTDQITLSRAFEGRKEV